MTLLAIVLLISASAFVAESCLCTLRNPQDIFCYKQFVGLIDIAADDIFALEDNKNRKGLVIIAKATIVQIFKGRYEDFREGDKIEIYTQITLDGCMKAIYPGLQLITGNPIGSYEKSLLMTSCDVNELFYYFTPIQIAMIKANLHNRAYIRGCRKCDIKRAYDSSFVESNECGYKYVFPIATEACAFVNGRCRWITNPRIDFRHYFSMPTATALEVSPSPPSTTSHTAVISSTQPVLIVRDEEVSTILKAAPEKEEHKYENQPTGTTDTTTVTTSTEKQYEPTETRAIKAPKEGGSTNDLQTPSTEKQFEPTTTQKTENYPTKNTETDSSTKEYKVGRYSVRITWPLAI